MTTTSVTSNIQINWPNIVKNTNYGKHANIWQKIATKIIKNNIPHTPAKVGVMVRKTFSHTPDEAMSGGLAKACDPGKNLFC